MTTAPAPQVTGVLGWKEACEYLRIGRTKLYELTKDGHIRSVSYPSATGRRRPLRYERAELDRFIAANRN